MTRGRPAGRRLLALGAEVPDFVRVLEGPWRVEMMRSLESLPAAARVGDVVLGRWDVTHAGALARLRRASGQVPLVHFLVMHDGEDVASHPLVASRLAPGWCHVASRSALHALLTSTEDPSAMQLRGLGPHHVGVRMVPGTLAAMAVGLLFHSSDAGPSLHEVAEALDRAPSQVAHGVKEATDLTFGEVRRRRCASLLLLLRCCHGLSVAEAARRIGVMPRHARSLLARYGLVHDAPFRAAELQACFGHPARCS